MITRRRSSATVVGSLSIVGSGIQSFGQVVLEAWASIVAANHVFYLVTDELTESWIRSLNPNSESLADCYSDGGPRMAAYEAMIGRILAAVRKNQRVCVVLYGHPGVFVYPSHEAIRRARMEGFEARMLPGVSAEDCLFADLGVDPGREGCQSYEATSFLVRPRPYSPYAGLILWQVGVIGDSAFHNRPERYRRGGIKVLVEMLGALYPPDHEVVIYEAAQLPLCDPHIVRIPLKKLATAKVSPISTLYVPPIGPAPVDREMVRRLGMESSKPKAARVRKAVARRASPKLPERVGSNRLSHRVLRLD